MKCCENCKTELPEEARFCGNCGAIIGIPADGQTRISNAQRINPSGAQAPAGISLPGVAPVSPMPAFTSGSQWHPYMEKQLQSDSDTPAVPYTDEDEERRRRAALLGMGLVAMGAFPQGGSVPSVLGTPQVGSVPSVSGTPQAPGSAMQGGMQGGTLQVAPHAPPMSMPSPVSPTPHLPSNSSPTLTLHPHHPPSGSSSGSSGSSPKHGCAPTLIIAAIIIPLVIIASIIGLGLTLFAPSLSLSGSNSVTSGGTLHLHGSHFLPGGSIELTLDATTPVFVVSPQFTHAMAFTDHAHQAIHSLAQLYVPSAGNNSINARSDGTFDATINIAPSWSSGQHTIVASEASTHRSASLSFTILGPFTTPSPTLSPTVTGTVTPKTLTPTPSSTAPSSASGLSCINPASLSLGPVSENYVPAMTSTVTLCASGSGVIRWQASQGPSWLSLSTTSGQIDAPGEVQITVSASAAQLGPGNYTTTISFSSPSSSATQTLKVSFMVQAGCIKASPGSLSFMGVANVSDAAAQAVVLTNCGATGTWTASAKTSDGSNWLYVNPANATLSGGATSSSVSVSTSNLKVKLAPNTYTGSVTFAIGSGSFTVQVTLIVQAAPNLSANTNSLTGSADCSSSNSTYLCYVTLTNDSSNLSLTWTYSQKLIPSLVAKPSSYTLAPGQSERVPLYISQNDCSSAAQIIFTGPNNSVTVYWYCYPPIG